MTGSASRLRLADLLGGLSIVADLGFGLPPQEAMRTCLVSTALARRMGSDRPTCAMRSTSRC